MGHPTPRTPLHSWGTDVGRRSKFFRSSWAPDIGSGQFLYTLIFAMFKIVIQFLGQFGLDSSVHGWNIIRAWPFRAKRMYASLTTIENRNIQTRKSIPTIYVYDMTTCTPIYEYCNKRAPDKSNWISHLPQEVSKSKWIQPGRITRWLYKHMAVL